MINTNIENAAYDCVDQNRTVLPKRQVFFFSANKSKDNAKVALTS